MLLRDSARISLHWVSMLMFDFPLSMNEYNSLLKSLLYVDKKNGENLINHELQEAYVHVYELSEMCMNDDNFCN